MAPIYLLEVPKLCEATLGSHPLSFCITGTLMACFKLIFPFMCRLIISLRVWPLVNKTHRYKMSTVFGFAPRAVFKKFYFQQAVLKCFAGPFLPPGGSGCV